MLSLLVAVNISDPLLFACVAMTAFAVCSVLSQSRIFICFIHQIIVVSNIGFSGKSVLSIIVQAT